MNIDWTVKEFRQFLEIIEKEAGVGHKIIRFRDGWKVYQLGSPIWFTHCQVERESHSILGEIKRADGITPYVMKDTVDFMMERDYSSLKKRYERPSIIKENP